MYTLKTLQIRNVVANVL